MEIYEIEIHAFAHADLMEIIATIHDEDPDAAVRWQLRFQKTIASLSQFPYRGAIPMDRKIARKGYRMLILRPYTIFYTIDEAKKVVVAMRVLHERRDLPRYL